jgi:hypothetical protein
MLPAISQLSMLLTGHFHVQDPSGHVIHPKQGLQTPACAPHIVKLSKQVLPFAGQRQLAYPMLKLWR